MRAVALSTLLVAACLARAHAHDMERTRVTLAFAEDGRYVLDIAHDPNWLLLRLESFASRSTRIGSLTASGGAGPLADAARDARIAALGPVLIDRVVLWVDGREVRPESAEYLPADATFRLRGRMPADARTLRWLYGAVADPYPLVIRRADGRTLAEVIEGANWSGSFDLSGQFKQATFAGVDYVVWIIGAFAAALILRRYSLTSRTRMLRKRTGLP